MPNLTRLNAVLDEYQDIADSDPEKLRQLIPSEEIWRFFIDGIDQENGRKLSQAPFFKPHTLSYGSITLFSINTLTYTVKQYIEEVDKLTDIQEINPTSNHFFHYGNNNLYHFLLSKRWYLNPKEYQQLTLGDLLQLDKAWMPYERNQPGYFKACCTAFQEIFDPSNELSIEYILKLHSLSLIGVQGTNYDNQNEELGGFRSFHRIGFGLTARNCTEAGIYELLVKIQNGATNYIEIGRDGFTITDAHLKEILNDKEENNSLTKYCQYFSTDPTTSYRMQYVIPHLKEIQKIKDIKLLANYLYKSAISTTSDIRLKSYEFESPVDEILANKMQHLLDTYKNQIKNAIRPAEKLFAIISFIQDSEQLHPFWDLNCRAFCIHLLNDLLKRNGFPLAILDDPNRFDCYSREELFDEVVKGMENTFTLIEQKKLFNVNTQHVMHFLASKTILGPWLNYFQEVVDIENQGRMKFANTCLRSNNANSG